jgi:hypothetical protein
VYSALQRGRRTLRGHLHADRRDEWRTVAVSEAERAAVDRVVAAAA